MRKLLGLLALALLCATAAAGQDVIASGLDSPRGLAFTLDRALLVAEAGRGGAGPCFPGPEGTDVCLGSSGAVTQVKRGVQSRILTGLPSFANPDGTTAVGPADVAPLGLGLTLLTIGGGGDAAKRALLPPPAHALGTIALIHQKLRKPTTWSIVADPTAYEAIANPDGVELNSNPFGIVPSIVGGIFVDAGGNTVLRADWRGRISLLALLPSILVPSPPFIPNLPPMIPMEAVPTSLAIGRDGAIYVGQLTGFPFPVGGAKVWRIAHGQAPTVYADGFTNIIGIAFGHDGSLWVLEIATKSLLVGPPGALWRVPKNGPRELVTDQLFFPGGLTIGPDGAAYVTNNGILPGAGQVLRFAP